MTVQDSLLERIVLVTGPAGAGRTSAVKFLEDLGFEAIDNMPLRLVPRLFDGATGDRALALGIDTRNRDFSTYALISLITRLGEQTGARPLLLYLDCRADVLMQRFSETRRRHPLAEEESAEIAISREIELLEPVRARADALIDTSDLTVHQLRDEIERRFAPAGHGLAVSVQSFSYRRGLPRGLDMVFDVRFLRNPHWSPDLRPLDGRAAAVSEHIQDDPRYAPFFEKVTELVRMLLPAYREEGKAYLTIGFGCTGGQHRSVALAEALAKALAKDAPQVSIRHRELERGRTGEGSA